MNVTVFGATGDVGSRVVAEALSRGHTVTAVARNKAKLALLPDAAKVRAADVEKPETVARLLAGQDLAISALRPPEGREETLVPLTRSILEGAAQAGVRVLVVGGAASLRLGGQGDTTVLTAPSFLPERLLPIARACFEQFQLCRAGSRLNHTGEQRADDRDGE